MGVHQLWTILQPATTVLPLEALANQRVVVDLSCWIVECSGTRMPGVHHRWQPHLHLQGLFHRLRALLALNCTIACVADGDFDPLKRPTVTARMQGPLSQQQLDKANAARYAGGAASKRPQHSHFGRMVRDAVRLCEMMGISCIQSPLDAEAQCAILNAAGLFDVCITTDSDAFLFGALKVYRSFKLDGQSGCDGVVEVCTMKAVQEKLGFGRNSLIALGVFLGSDYHEGVKGFGVQRASRLVAQLGESRVLETLLKNGVQAVLAEGQPKKGQAKKVKAAEGAEDPGGPSRVDEAAIAAVINAFSHPVVHAPTSEAVTRALEHDMEVQLDPLVSLMQQYLDWDEEKTKSFLLPKLAERGLRRRAAQLQQGLRVAPLILPALPLQYTLKDVRKERTVKYVRCYDVSWHGSPPLGDTTVPAALLEKAYPDRVQQFKDAEAAEKLLKKKAARSRKGAKPQTTSNPRSGRDGSSEVLNPLPENLHSAALRSDGPDRLFVCGPSAEQTVCLVGRSLAAERERLKGVVRGSDEDIMSDKERERAPSWSDRPEGTPASDPWCKGADRFSGTEESEDCVAGKQRGRTEQRWTAERGCVTQETEKPGQHLGPSRLMIGGPSRQSWDGTVDGHGLESGLRWGDKGSGATIINLDSDSNDDDVGKTAEELRASTALFVQAGTEGHKRNRCGVRGVRAESLPQQAAGIASRLRSPLGIASRSKQRVSSQNHRQPLLYDPGVRRGLPVGSSLSAPQSANRLKASCSSPDSSPPSSPKLVLPDRSIRSILASINLGPPRPAPTLSLCG